MAHEWTVTCRDQDGRRKSVTVMAEQGKVVLITPPGAAVEFYPLDVGRLRAALRSAIVAIEDPAGLDAASPPPA